MSKPPTNKPRKPGLLARLNRALTEVDVKHFDDDLDWDARVKLPEWQLARLKQRHAQRKQAQQLGGSRVDDGADRKDGHEH